MMNVVCGIIEYRQFLGSVWNWRMKLCIAIDQHERPDRTTPLHSAQSMALSAMAIEYEWF